ncbi:MalY/PatB family protein [Fusibacter ferrireducens]|uniref:cysteine-S-conjugate beta-lyase n=1 Tax=Fusibacter ferrireducens TaxID=2785058 RepID=A0ABR9ZSK3_9FIRM|nr:aminotransferase class I/II-fold pyridoxal phosphate-dependent enzyme [Fusibacter ferrireducens]MBF4693437.1 aminotransferase class I/II-fold pyridoxal phosphate-dependent enzyme [Fusibacter ferrireducens]
MNYDFDSRVNRKHMGNLKETLCPPHIKALDLLGYSGAEMEFKTAPSVIKAMTDCVQNGLMGFTLCDDQYRNAVCWWMATQRDFHVEKEWVVPTNGTIFSVATVIRMLTDIGEGIIVSPPIYYRYEQAATRLGRKTHYNALIESEGKYSIDFDDLEQKMADPKNKLYILCNPHNPTGKVWDKRALEQLSTLANKYNVVVYSDEIFGEITFDDHRCIPYSEIKGARRHAIVATSLGKTFNFTGVNHANMIILDEQLRANFIKQRDADHFGSIDPVLYAALLGAYSEEGADWKNAMVAHLKACGEMIFTFFNKYLPQVKISPLEGSFVIWIDWRGLNLGDEDLNQFLVNEAYLELDQGSDYGQYYCGFTRMSIAVPKKDLKKSLDLLLKAAEKRGFIPEGIEEACDD